MNQDYWIHHGSASCQHVDADFSSSKQVIKGRFRLCPKSIFTHEHKLTKETSKRSWLCYSPAKSSLFCFTCKVMNVKGNQFAEGGFNDWNNAVQRVQKHEQSPAHRDALISILNRQNERQRVDCQLTKELKDEKEYWTQVLERIVAVISFIAERGLAFRGDEEIIGSAHNGNYLGILELLAKFDPFLQEHIKNYAHKGKGTTSYLSHSICDEFIALLAQEVLAKIVDELKTQKFFSVSLDSTPDITHVDQLTLIVRYVLPSGPVERFVKFLSMEGHSADQMYQSLRSFFDEHGIDTKYLRGQSYDNASNMSGRYNGLQAKVKEDCPYADFVPCYGHSLNLVGTRCAECCQQALLFFDFVSSLYNFFSASTGRWDLLLKELKKHGIVLTLKQLCGTRWSERADATKALRKNYPMVGTVLEQIAASDDQKAEVRLQAEGLHNTLHKLETGIMLVFWDNVLSRFQRTRASLQAADVCLNSAQSQLQSLSPFIESLKSTYSEIEREAKQLTGCDQYEEERKRVRKRKRHHDELPDETENLPPAKKFELATFNVIIDSLLLELNKRQNAYKKLYNVFGILQDLSEASGEQISTGAENLVAAYPEDLEDDLVAEMIQFSALLKTDIAKNNDLKLNSVARLYDLIKKHNLESTFPNMDIVLRIYLSLMVTNCSGERSFSKLKRIKNEQRASIGQNRLNHLSLLSIEHELLRDLDTKGIISKFAAQKARRRVML